MSGWNWMGYLSSKEKGEVETMTYDEWKAEAERRFGKDSMKWRFVCPVCGHIASVEDWKKAGAPATAVAFSCVGRWIEGSKEAFTKDGKGPCTYAGGGLFQLNPVDVVFPDGKTVGAFAFAEVEAVKVTEVVGGK